MKWIALLAAFALAGCVADGGIDSGIIVNGDWNMENRTEVMLVYAHNTGDQSATVNWDLEVPSGWEFDFQSDSAMLDADGTKLEGARGYEYPDWTWTLLTLTVPEDATGSHTIQLLNGDSSTDIGVNIDSTNRTVSRVGDSVSLNYHGKFDDGSTFDQGAFDTVLGSGRTVPGFDYGLLGLPVGKEESLHLPPFLGYGYDNPPGNYERFNGEWLTFDVSLNSIS